MATTTLVPVEEYLRRTEKPNAEYVDGVVYPKPMPTWPHGIIQSELAVMLRRLGLYAGSEITLRMSATKFLVPDVVGAREIQQPYSTEPVFLCCEILSPGDRMSSTLAKCEGYHDWGVPYCWIIDPERCHAWEYPRGGELARATEALRAGEISLNLAELFSAIKL